MRNQMKVIHEQSMLGQVLRVYGTEEEPLFLAKDVAAWIEHNNIAHMMNIVDDDEKLKETIYYAGQKRAMYFLTESGLKHTLANSRKKKAKELYSLIFNEDITTYKNTPKQTLFEYELEKSINSAVTTAQQLQNSRKTTDALASIFEYEVESKVPNTFYRVDFFFREANIIVEYDEKAHDSQQAQDELREQRILRELGSNITFIRIKEGKEIEGLVRLVTLLNYRLFTELSKGGQTYESITSHS